MLIEAAFTRATASFAISSVAGPQPKSYLHSYHPISCTWGRLWVRDSDMKEIREAKGAVTAAAAARAGHSE